MSSTWVHADEEGMGAWINDSKRFLFLHPLMTADVLTNEQGVFERRINAKGVLHDSSHKP